MIVVAFKELRLEGNFSTSPIISSRVCTGSRLGVNWYQEIRQAYSQRQNNAKLVILKVCSLLGQRCHFHSKGKHLYFLADNFL